MGHMSELGDWVVAARLGFEPPPGPQSHLQPPLVLVQPRWEYRHLVRLLTEEPAPEEAELNRLGAGGWELVNTLFDGRMVHLYFKREAH